MAAKVGGLFISSAIMGADPETGQVPSDGARQVDLLFGNARRLLQQADVPDGSIAYVAVYLQDNSLRPKLNECWIDWFPSEDDRPARHVTLQELPGEMLVQLQIFAFAPEG